MTSGELRLPSLAESDTAVTSTDENNAGQVPGLLEVLALVPDPRKLRGRRDLLIFVLAVAAACALAELYARYGFARVRNRAVAVGNARQDLIPPPAPHNRRFRPLPPRRPG
jgi:hypothetical protein